MRKGDAPKSLDEVNPKLLDSYSKLRISLRQQEHLAGVAVDPVLTACLLPGSSRRSLEKGFDDQRYDRAAFSELQPRNRGTGPGIVLPLAQIYLKNPETIVWELGQPVPAMMTAFGDPAHYLGSGRESQMLDSLYESMPHVKFSSPLVEKLPAAAVLVELRDLVTSDWGNEERISETLRRIRKTPLFAVEHLSRPILRTLTPS